MEDNLIKELSREKLSRLSSDFEVELLRLIKTLNLISQSKELFKNQVEEIESISNNLKIKTNDFTIKLLEIEKSAREGMRDTRNDFNSTQDTTPSLDYDTIIKEVTQFREIIDIVDKDIERAKTEHLNRLDSFYSVYNLELKASQGELDTKLFHLKELLTQAQPEGTVEETIDEQIPAGPEPANTQGNGSGEPSKSDVVPKRHFPKALPGESPIPHAAEIPKRKINLSHDAPYRATGSIYSSSSLLMGIVFLFFGALVGVTTFYMLDFIGGDDTAPVLREQTYSDKDLTGAEEYSALSTTNKETSPQSAREAITREGATNPRSAQVSPDDNFKPYAYETSLEESAAGTTGENVPDKTIETAARGIGNDNDITTGPSAPGNDIYTVMGPGANVRSGPSMSYSVATIVLEGDMFVSMGEKHGIWIKVMAPDGTQGWISKKLVKEIN